MARLTYSDLSNAINQMHKADIFNDQNVKEILTAGTDVMLDNVKTAFVRAGHNNPGKPRRTGKTLRHFARSRKVRRTKDDVPYMVVTVNGKDERGQRYGTKAFVLNYGRRRGGRIPADYYLTISARNAWGRVNETMINIMRNKLEGR